MGDIILSVLVTNKRTYRHNPEDFGRVGRSALKCEVIVN